MNLPYAPKEGLLYALILSKVKALGVRLLKWTAAQPARIPESCTTSMAPVNRMEGKHQAIAHLVIHSETIGMDRIKIVRALDIYLLDWSIDRESTCLKWIALTLGSPGVPFINAKTTAMELRSKLLHVAMGAKLLRATLPFTMEHVLKMESKSGHRTLWIEHLYNSYIWISL